MNLFKETKKALGVFHYAIADVAYVCTLSGGNKCTIEEFMEMAMNIDYDNGYGSAKIREDLIIIMKDGDWFNRGEYDGSEWWTLNRAPVLVNNPTQLTNLMEKSYEY